MANRRYSQMDRKDDAGGGSIVRRRSNGDLRPVLDGVLCSRVRTETACGPWHVRILVEATPWRASLSHVARHSEGPCRGVCTESFFHVARGCQTVAERGGSTDVADAEPHYPNLRHGRSVPCVLPGIAYARRPRPLLR